jgi:hypothetical protein
MKITRFEDIEAWQEARRLVKMVYEVTNGSQKFKAVGYGRKTTPEYASISDSFKSVV